MKMSRERVQYLKSNGSEEKVSLLKSNNDAEPIVESKFESIPAIAGQEATADPAAEHKVSIPMVPVKTSEEDDESKIDVLEVEEKVDEEDENVNLLVVSQETDDQENQECWIVMDKRKLGLALNLVLTNSAFIMALYSLDARHGYERGMSLMTLFSFLVTVVWLYAHELTCGLGLVFFQNPALPWTIKETAGMQIGNVGFGITFAFGMMAQALACLVLWYFMAIAVAFIVYYPLDKEKKHNTAIVSFVILLTCTLIVEEVVSPVVVGWFQMALCFIFVGVFIMLVEKVFRAKEVKTCSPGLYRNQLYIVFSFVFYLIGLVARAFRTN